MNRNQTDCTCLVGFFDAFNFTDSSTFDCRPCLIDKCLTCNTQIE